MSLVTVFRRTLTVFLWNLKDLKIGEIYDQLMSRELYSAEEWETYQNQQLREFVTHCYDFVPYYTELFDSLKLSPLDIKTKEDLIKIPVLTKDIVRENQDKLLATNISRDLLTRTNTSGSTGQPLTLYSDKQRATYLAAGLWRVYSMCGWKPGERIAYIWGFKEGVVSKNGLKKSIKEFLTGATYFSAWKANEDDFRSWYNTLSGQKITLISCYASSGGRFAQWLLDNNLKLEGIKGVYCTSEKLFDHQKEVMEKAFNAKVYNLYGCGEVNHIACTCYEGMMHINPDMVIVEEGEKNTNGDTPLILTGFRNRAMPFLRYINGDSGALKKGDCKCGRQSMQMNLEVTRLSDVFTFSSGKKYPSLYFILRIYKDGFEGIDLFQFYQDKIDHVYFYIVKNSKFNDATENNLKNVVIEIENHIDNEARVELVYKDYIEQSQSSKHYYAKSDIK
jgi:phenylacetate-CoA ligase